MAIKEKEIETKKVSLGHAKEFDPDAPNEEIFIPPATLDARQDAIGVRRKYAGPTSKTSVHTMADAVEYSDAEPSECEDTETDDDKTPLPAQ